MEEKTLNAIYTWENFFAVVSKDEQNKTGGNYTIFVLEDEIIFKMSKKILPAYQANKNGILGMLLNNLFSKFLKPSFFSIDLKKIKKIEHAISVDPIGRNINNFMFWEQEDGDYNNITFSITPMKPKMVDAVKDMINNILPNIPVQVKNL